MSLVLTVSLNIAIQKKITAEETWLAYRIAEKGRKTEQLQRKGNVSFGKGIHGSCGF